MVSRKHTGYRKVVVVMSVTIASMGICYAQWSDRLIISNSIYSGSYNMITKPTMNDTFLKIISSHDTQEKSVPITIGMVNDNQGMKQIDIRGGSANDEVSLFDLLGEDKKFQIQYRIYPYKNVGDPDASTIRAAKVQEIEGIKAKLLIDKPVLEWNGQKVNLDTNIGKLSDIFKSEYHKQLIASLKEYTKETYVVELEGKYEVGEVTIEADGTQYQVVTLTLSPVQSQDKSGGYGLRSVQNTYLDEMSESKAIEVEAQALLDCIEDKECKREIAVELLANSNGDIYLKDDESGEIIEYSQEMLPMMMQFNRNLGWQFEIGIVGDWRIIGTNTTSIPMYFDQFNTGIDQATNTNLLAGIYQEENDEDQDKNQIVEEE